ncbi:MAG: DUF2344 domain-containing protein [Clostridia bacterium]|nr:DUF2344 domain-containing protein [Clostridia bacterium]
MLPEKMNTTNSKDQMFPIRVRFCKKGRLRFISHLDLQRTMKSVFARSGLPIWYTEGFNPHAKMVFSLPIPLGAESECEYLDFRLTRNLPLEHVRDKMSAAMTEELMIRDIYKPGKSKLSDIKYCSYDIFPERPIDLSILDGDKIIIMKRSKRGEKETDIKPLIRFAGVTHDDVLKATLSADSDNYLRPDVFAGLLGIPDAKIVKTHAFFEDMRLFK